jgi:hypothetical protein
LQESVRKVTVRVSWDETGRPDRSIEVVQYLTDPSQLEKSILPPGSPGGPGAPGTTPPGSTPTPSNPFQGGPGTLRGAPFGMPQTGIGR